MIIFVKPHIHYDSYTDFWRLVELSSFDWCYPESVNLFSPHTYIHSPIDKQTKKLSWWQKKRKYCRMIIWDLERPKPRGGLKKHIHYLQKFNYDEIWHSDYQLGQDTGFKFVVLGSDIRLGQKPSFFKRYKFTHLSYENGRRETILEQLNCKIGPNCWGRQRRKVLAQTKFGLNIHQDNDLYSEPLRFAIFAAFGLPIISETLYHSFLFDDIVKSIPYTKLVEFCKNVTYNRTYYQLGKETQQRLCYDYQFGNMIKLACHE